MGLPAQGGEEKDKEKAAPCQEALLKCPLYVLDNSTHRFQCRKPQPACWCWFTVFHPPQEGLNWSSLGGKFVMGKFPVWKCWFAITEHYQSEIAFLSEAPAKPEHLPHSSVMFFVSYSTWKCLAFPFLSISHVIVKQRGENMNIVKVESGPRSVFCF